MSDDVIDDVILAIEDLIDDVECRKEVGRPQKYTMEARQRLKEALRAWKAEK